MTSGSIINKLSSNHQSCSELLKDPLKLSSNLISGELSSASSNSNKDNLINKQRRCSWASFKFKSLKLNGIFKDNRRNRALTVTLFGVVASHIICHFPAVIAKIVYVLFPSIEFESKSLVASVCLDLSNFLIMLNSSMNFVLYVVFGPGRFREEFSIIFFTMFSCCFKYFRFTKKETAIRLANFNERSNSRTVLNSISNSSNINGVKSFYENRFKKCSLQSNSEYNMNSVVSTPMIEITCETLNENSSKEKENV